MSKIDTYHYIAYDKPSRPLLERPREFTHYDTLHNSRLQDGISDVEYYETENFIYNSITLKHL